MTGTSASAHPSFASDYWAPVHPAVLAAIGRANVGHAPAYGEDPFTGEAVERLKGVFGPTADPYFVFNGTSANVLAIGSCCRSYETVINLIANTKNRGGLVVRARLDRRSYPTGKKVPPKELRALRIERDDFHGDWNYVLRPRADAG